MKTVYQTKGTCSKAIVVDVDDSGIINEVEFAGGCPGNTMGISQLSKA